MRRWASITDYPKSLSAYQKALQHYTAADKTSHQFYTKLDIGQLYIQLWENRQGYLGVLGDKRNGQGFTLAHFFIDFHAVKV